jgi:hypothetical protein
MFIGIGLPITAQRFVGGVVAPAAFDFSLAGGMTYTDLAETTPAVLDDAVASVTDGTYSLQQVTLANRPNQEALGVSFDNLVPEYLALSDAAYISQVHTGTSRVKWRGTVQDLDNDYLWGLAQAVGLTQSGVGVQILNTGRVRAFYEQSSLINSVTTVSVGVEFTVEMEITDADYALILNGVEVGRQAYIGPRFTAQDLLHVGANSRTGAPGSPSNSTPYEFSIYRP